MTFDRRFPEGFVVVVDTREQDPLFLRKPPKGLVVVRDTLALGDYSIRGFERSFIVEAKSLSDLYASVGVGHEAFRARLARMAEAEWKALVIKASEHAVLKGSWHSKLNPNVVRGALAKWEVEFDLHVYYASCPADAERWVLDRMVHYYRLKREGRMLS